MKKSVIENKNFNVKKEFYNTTKNSSLSLFLFGLVGTICFYYLGFPIIFNFFKSVLIFGIITFISSFFITKLTISIQDKMWIGILLLTIVFSLNSHFNVKNYMINDYIIENNQDVTLENNFGGNTLHYKDDVAAIKINGKNNIKNIKIRFNYDKMTNSKDNYLSSTDILNGSETTKDIEDIKEEVKERYIQSNSELKEILKEVNSKFVKSKLGKDTFNLLYNYQKGYEFNPDNIDNAIYIKNMFYFEDDGVVMTGSIQKDLSVKLSIRPKNYIFKLFGI